MSIIRVLQHAGKFKHYPPKQIIFQEGMPDDTMYIVVQGEVDIVINNLVFNTVQAGDIIGEMALIDKVPHSASAIARTRCTLAPIDEETFFAMVQENPSFALEVMRIMARRLRRMNET